MAHKLDLIIENGKVLDGTGNPWFYADIGVLQGNIKVIGKLNNIPATDRIDAKDKVVAPGFIDTHVHSELGYLVEPDMEPKIRQGITTEIAGQDGLSVAPLTKESRPILMKRLTGLVGKFEVEWDWLTVKDYFHRIDMVKPATNVAFLAPHGTIRIAVMGFQDRNANETELRKMKELVRQSMEDGAVGLSTGLAYSPCNYANVKELVELCSIVAEYNGVFVVHMRNESDYIIDAVQEVLHIARESGVALNISHLKVAGKHNHGNLAVVLNILDKARIEGIDVTFDQYPYVAGSTFLDALLPPWVHAGKSTKTLLERLRDNKTRSRIADELSRPAKWDNMAYACGWDAIYITSVVTSKNRCFEGKNIEEISDTLGVSPADAVFNLLLDEQCNVTMVGFWGTEELIHLAMQHPLQMVCSDSIYGSKPHPRLFGTYPRVLGKYVREDRVLSLPDAVRRMTSTPAQRYGLFDRGLIRIGLSADLVVFDPETIADIASYTDPNHYSVGIDYVIVNGVVTMRERNLTGKRGGQSIRLGRRSLL